MLKSLGFLLGGVFIGAVGAEVVRKKYPETVHELHAKACRVITEAKEAFKNGYRNASEPKPATV